jgi:DNA-binding NarL/FixJ family response regulator
LKDTPPPEIVRAIEHVHAGEGMLSPAVTRRLIALVADDGGRREEARARLEGLSAREREVALAVGRGCARDRRRAAHERGDREGPRLAAAGQA